MTIKFKVTGMTCSACSSMVEKVAKKAGAQTAIVNLLSATAIVTVPTEDLGESIRLSIIKSGYSAEYYDSALSKSLPIDDAVPKLKKMLLSSIIFLVPLLYISMGHMIFLPLPNILTPIGNPIIFAGAQAVLTLIIVIINFSYFKNGISSAFHGGSNMNTLIAIGAGAAVIYGVFALGIIIYGVTISNNNYVEHFVHDLYFESAATILTLITLGKYLEQRSKKRTGDAAKELLDLAPKTANVLSENKEQTFNIEDVEIGHIIVIRPGEAIPLDGVVVFGESSIDESVLTGESMPRDVGINNNVSCGTISLSSALHVKVTSLARDSTITKIAQLVENASATKAPIGRLADKISGIFVPIVCLIAVITFISWLVFGNDFSMALQCAISVLVISCPCALGLATPVAIMVSTGVAAKYGILIKSAEVLENAHNIKTVVFDKTGTITFGKPFVTKILPYNDANVSDLLTIAYSIEKSSEHPAAYAITKYCEENSVSTIEISGFSVVGGRGIKAFSHGNQLLAGNLRLMVEHNVEMEQLGFSLSNGESPIYFAKNHELIGIITVCDKIKPYAKAAISKLKQMNIKTILLSGDNTATASMIGETAGIDEVISEVLPVDKEKKVRELIAAKRNSIDMVCMVGDGINDAPALSSADVGIAMSSGTDIAMSSADIVLMRNQPFDVVNTIKISRTTIRNIKQNLFWAFFYNTIGIPLATGVFYPFLGITLNPMIAAAAMCFSSIFVVLNALRLKSMKINEINDKNKGSDFMNYKIKISGMSCSHCTGRVEKSLNNIEGVSAKVDLESATAHITAESSITQQQLLAAINDCGYSASSVIVE